MRRIKYEVGRVDVLGELHKIRYVCNAEAYPLRVAERETVLRVGIYLVMNIKTKEIKAYSYDGKKFTRIEIPERIVPSIARWINRIENRTFGFVL